MRKNIYQTFVKCQQGFIYYNALHNAYIVLNPRLHEVYQNSSLEDIEKSNTKLYETLKMNGFIVENDFEEFKIAQLNRLLGRFNKNEYDVTLNTTLDCNLKCWYCYENKVKGSKVDATVLELIKQNIKTKYIKESFSKLKISFFGGEPLKEFDIIKKLLLFADTFCIQRCIELQVDITSNGTLLTNEMINFLKDYKINFQITLDGHREKHNKVRIFENNQIQNSYDLIIKNITKIENSISNAHTYIRINFDNKTLLHIDEILSDINHLNRRKNTIILRKVWQVDSKKIDKELIIKSLLSIMSKNFFVDYFALPRIKPCFAEKVNQVLFNYDGKVFKCSTIENFDDSNTEGILKEDGSIEWNQVKIANKIIHTPSRDCSQCNIYPACYGPCSMNKTSICLLDNLNLTKDEYILYNFRQTMMLS